MASSSSFDAAGASSSTREQQRIARIKEGLSRLKNYELPSTSETVHSLEHIKTSQTHNEIESQVSPTGKQLLHDTDNLITISQKILNEKNEDDHFQQMILHSKRAVDLADKEALKSMRGQGSQLKGNLTSSYTSFINIVKMLISSGEFRGAMKSLISVLMDIFKYNMGGAVDEKSKVPDARDTAHRVVDMVADVANTATTEQQNDMETNGSTSTMHPERIKHLGKHTLSEAKSKAYNMQIPDEYKEELITRLKDALVRFQRRPDFQKSLDEFFTGMSNVFESSKMYSREQMEKGKQALRESEADQEWKIAFDHARALIQNIFNGKSLTGVINAIREFANDIRQDSYLLAWFQGWKNFIQEMLRDPEYVESDRFRIEAHELANQTDRLVSDKYKDNARNVFDLIKDFLSGAAQDPTNKEFMEALKQLWIDACLDENGNLTIKRELLKDIPRILSILSDKIANIPLPRIEHDTPEMYFMMDNVILKCSGLIPTHFEVDVNVRTDLSIPQLVSHIVMRMSHIQVSATSLDFSVRKKTGFFKLSETGKMDFDITGSGISGELMFVPWIQELHNGQIEKGLNLETCKVSVGDLNINIYDTEKHRIRYKLFKGLIEKIVKKQIGIMISENLRKLIDPHRHTDVDRMKKNVSEMSDNTTIGFPTGQSNRSNNDLHPTVDKWANKSRNEAESRSGADHSSWGGGGGRNETMTTLRSRMDSQQMHTNGHTQNALSSQASSGNGFYGGLPSNI